MTSQKTIGLLGGGQLGRMFLESANRHNINVNILDAPKSSAKQISAQPNHIDGSFASASDVKNLAQNSDIITIEIEHVDTEALEQAANEHPDVKIEPSWKTIRLIQDKYAQKEHLSKKGIPVANYCALGSNTVETVKAIAADLGYPLMLKSRREAYDGRGNYPVRSEADIPAALEVLGKKGLYAEQWATFRMELAVMVVKAKDNTVLAFPTVETVHEDSICKLVYAPARGISNALASQAQELAKKAVASLDGKGVFGVEMFLVDPSASPTNSSPNPHNLPTPSDLSSSADNEPRLLINEIAPRPHNSGHYTIEACPISQYDAHLRAILDLPIPERSLRMRCPASIMLNILGGSTKDSHLEVAKAALEIPNASVHLYGKGDARPGRKMGHITVTGSSMREAEEAIRPLIKVVDRVRAERPDIKKKMTTFKEILKLKQDLSTNSSAPSSLNGPSPLVAVIMGSDSDMPHLKPAFDHLKRLEIPFSVHITSAHRTSDWMSHFTKNLHTQTTIRVIIAAAGGAAHLPGMAAAHTPLPVIGVPIKGSSLDGNDSLLSIVQMPRGVPVATVGINNAVNAALLAGKILGTGDAEILERMQLYMDNARDEVYEKEKRLQDIGYEEYLGGMRR